MSDVLGWIGWAVAVVITGYGLVERNARIRATNATRRRMDLESAQLALDVLNVSSQNQQAQLAVIVAALGADSPARPDAAVLDRIAASGDAKDELLVKHLRSRETARAELPDIVSRLDAVQARRMALEQEINASLPVKNEAIDRLRDELHNVGEQLTSLIRTLVESPRIFTSDDEPKSPVEGDIWFRPESSGHQPESSSA